MKGVDNKQILLGLIRIGIGLIFLWAFFDKLVGLGFTTCRDAETGGVAILCDQAWFMGGSPTTGFLTFATHGPFAEIYQMLAGSMLVDWVFMLGLLGVGVGLTLGILMRASIVSGIIMLLMMYTAALPPEHHPFIDDHLIYLFILLYFWFIPVGTWLGYEKEWKKLVRTYPYLK